MTKLYKGPKDVCIKTELQPRREQVEPLEAQPGAERMRRVLAVASLAALFALLLPATMSPQGDPLFINKNGNVGIGTNDPKAKLDVNGDVAIEGKHALRGNDNWLRLNQDNGFTSGVVTPYLFAPGSLNVGGFDSWKNPGDGDVVVKGKVGIGVVPDVALKVKGVTIVEQMTATSATVSGNATLGQLVATNATVSGSLNVSGNAIVSGTVKASGGVIPAYDSGWKYDDRKSDHPTIFEHKLNRLPVLVMLYFSPDPRGQIEFPVNLERTQTHGNPVSTEVTPNHIYLLIWSGDPLHQTWRHDTGWKNYDSGYWRVVAF